MAERLGSAPDAGLELAGGELAFAAERPLNGVEGELTATLQAFTLHRPGEAGNINRYGIFEPDHSAPVMAPNTLQVILAPLVAFDAEGNRLGMGAGYYDRYYSDLPADAKPLLVGVAYEMQRTRQLEAEPGQGERVARR